MTYRLRLRQVAQDLSQGTVRDLFGSRTVMRDVRGVLLAMPWSHRWTSQSRIADTNIGTSRSCTPTTTRARAHWTGSSARAGDAQALNSALTQVSPPDILIRRQWLDNAHAGPRGRRQG
jgi:hypothetical protein